MSSSSMRKLRILIPLFAAMSAPSIGLLSVPAASASASQVLSDCNSNGHLTGSYSRSDLQGALSGMGADTKEYTNCYDVVRRALLSSATGGGHSGGGSGSSGAQGVGTTGSSRSAVGSTKHASSPVRQAAAGSGSGSPVALDGSSVRPGGVGIDTVSSTRSLPTPLIAVLVLLGLAALSGGAIALRRRVVARHGA